MPPTDEQKAKGFVGYSIENYKENLFSNYSFISKDNPGKFKVVKQHCKLIKWIVSF